MPTSPAPLGGLNLANVASGAGAETRTRVNAGQGMLAAALASMLQEQQGALAARQEGQGREHLFARAQQALDIALQQRGQNMQDAQSLARQRAEEQQAEIRRSYLTHQAKLDREAGLGPGGEPDWFTQQRFQTDENIRQAMALQALQQEAEIGATSPRLSDFGASAINPYRGQALEDLMSSKPTGSAAWRNPLTPDELKKTREAVKKYGSDPWALDAELRKVFKTQAGSSGRASLALWQIGYQGPPGT